MRKQYQFVFLDKSKISDTLPALFEILYENMEKIAPFGKPHLEAKNEWLNQVCPAMLKSQRQIVLMYDKDILAGYVQYYVNETTFMVEEIQIKPQYQRTMILFQFCNFIKPIIPSETNYIEAYADKRNLNSMQLIEFLGMNIIDQSEVWYHYQGDYKKLLLKFNK